jgi:tetratricopeptide (TPR) repeat protein
MKKYFILLMCTLQACATFILTNGQSKTAIDSLFQKSKNYMSACDKPCIGDSVKVNLMVRLAWELSFSRSDTVIGICNEAIELAYKINYPLGISQGYHVIGNVYQAQNDYPRAINFFSRELAVLDSLPSEEKTDKSAMSKRAACFNSMGNIYKAKGDDQNALKHFHDALGINERFKNEEAIAINNKNIGDLLLGRGDFAKALESYYKTLSIADKLNNENIQSATLGSMAQLYRRRGDLEKALEYYSKALAFNTSHNNKNAMGNNYEGLGLFYRDRNNPVKSLECYNEALILFREMNNKRGVASISNNIGSLYQDKADEFAEKKLPDSARVNYRAALAYYLSAGNIEAGLGRNTQLGTFLGNIGSTYLGLKDNTNGEKYLLQSLALSDSLGDFEGSNWAGEELSKYYTRIGKQAKALQYYKLAVTAKDSIFNEAKLKQLTRLEMNYEFDKKETAAKAVQEKKEIAQNAEIARQKLIRNSIVSVGGILILFAISSFFLYKRKRDAEQKQKEISLSLQVSETEMKALRSQMNPHFIFNALQSIQTFLLGHQSEEANTYLLKFAKLMRLVLENSQHSEVPLKEDMQALELYMQLESIRLKHPFTYQFHIDDSINIEDDCIPPLILQPFVENAIWHGLQYKSDPGHIDIYIKKTDNALFATVEDNGVGRDMSKETAHPMLIKKESLGMKLTEERLKILNELKNVNARFNITDLFTKDRKAAGTRVELSLPLA